MTKDDLFDMIKNDHLFWSYDVKSGSDVSDELLIEHVLIYSDVEVIHALFLVYGNDRVRRVWERRIVPDSRYKRLNVYLGRIFFDIEDIGVFIHEKTAAHSRYETLKRFDRERENPSS